ncbi:lecithin retinol acyltransferase family protein [Ascidiaceihabitans sp.]|uniref:lecithin retinol acyltransferase family protein n=1 Tax=Ascidiaceihabitans sp. TaxID=1872644 RepID=UPI003298A7F6
MEHSLKLGDIISVSKAIVIRHYGIYIGNNQVIHASPSCGKVCKISLEKFKIGKAIQVHTSPSRYSPPQIVMRAKSRLGRTYNLIDANCEHFKNEVVHGIAFSDQKKAVLTVGALFFAFKLLAK